MPKPADQDATHAAPRPTPDRQRAPAWAMAAAALAVMLALGWHGGWRGAVGTAGVVAAGLGLPWLRREGAHSGALAERLDPGRAQGKGQTPAAAPADFAAQASSGVDRQQGRSG